MSGDSPITAPEKAMEALMRTPALSMRADQHEYLQLILLAVAVGVLAALGNLGFRELIDLFGWIFRTVEWNALEIRNHSVTAILIPLILLSGGACLLVLDYFFPGDVLGYGFPNFLEMVNLGNARIKRRWIVLKAVGAALSLGCGASVGREGPIAQVGGAIGSALAQFRRLSADRAKVLVAAGAGAGIATTFNAPMGGMMFGIEIVLLGQAELANLLLVLIATFSAVLTSRGITGNAAVFHPMPFVIRSNWEMLTYGLMGVVVGLLAAGYVRFFHSIGAYFRALKIPQAAKLAIGLTIVGAIAIALPRNLSDGYPVIDEAFAGRFGLGLLMALTVAKFVASALSLNCGAPGGVFGPTFFIGTMAGGTFQALSHMVLPGLTGPRGSYALVGLGAYLGGVTHAPLTALFLLYEMTQLNYMIALPAMIATIGALVVSRWIERESIDTYSLAREGKTLEIGKERLVLTQLPVSSVMSKNVDIVHENASLADVLRTAGDTAQATLPVVSSDGDLAGLVVTRDLLGLLAGGAELGPLVNAYDIARRNCPMVTPLSNLDEAAQLMEYEALDEIPVVEGRDGGRFLGLVARHHIAQAFNRVAVSLSSMATRDPSIFWATGYRVARIRINAAVAGKTLRELDARARFSVTVLAVQDGSQPDSGFAPIAPDQRLKAGDLMIAAGRPAYVRRFMRDLEIGA
ncbi:MAG: chloride channel protein [Candidatus Binataceae bacterium]